MRQRKSIWTFYIPIVFFMVTVLFPFAWILLTSLKEKKEMFSAEFHFLPLEPTLNSYRELFEKTDFIHNMWNSLVVSFVTVLIAGIVSFMAGYALSRYRFKIRNGLMYFFLLFRSLSGLLCRERGPKKKCYKLRFMIQKPGNL